MDKQDATGAQMQDEEHERPLKAFQSPDFFGKEVGAKKNVSMSGQEPSPSQTFAIRRWRQTVSSQDVRYGGFRNLNA